MLTQDQASEFRKQLDIIRQIVLDLYRLLNDSEDRCQHSDYPYGTPPLIQCCRERDHKGKHKYIDADGNEIRHFLDSSKGKISIALGSSDD